MSKKVIQVPVDELLLKDLNTVSKKQRKARSELIREACAYYLKLVEREELDRLYRNGYKKIPEDAEVSKAQLKVIGEILPGESW
jgi:metal-responsive CopG/Arc/MetJ family transcriptional regulator